MFLTNCFVGISVLNHLFGLISIFLDSLFLNYFPSFLIIFTIVHFGIKLLLIVIFWIFISKRESIIALNTLYNTRIFVILFLVFLLIGFITLANTYFTFIFCLTQFIIYLIQGISLILSRYKSLKDYKLENCFNVI